jgi:hypothetical protein
MAFRGFDVSLRKPRFDPSKTIFAGVAHGHAGTLIFAQFTGNLRLTTFRRCVAAYGGEHKLKSFICLERFLCLAFSNQHRPK